MIAEGIVRCSDTNWIFDKKTQSWNSMSTEDIPLDEFYAIPNQVAGVIEEVHTVAAQLAALQPKRENPFAS